MSDAKTAGAATTGRRWLSLAAICTAAGLVWLAFADLGVAIPFGDIFGRRRMLGLGIVLFSAFSIVAALAPNVGMLIAGRGLMGIGAALILPPTLALIPAEFSGPAELTAFGVWQAVAWGGQAIGPAIGGILTLLVTGGIVLAALIVVRFLWPGRTERGAAAVAANPVAKNQKGRRTW